MKCPVCGAWTENVRNSMWSGDEHIRRTRVCGNDHRVTTYELPGEMLYGTPLAGRLRLRNRRGAAALDGAGADRQPQDGLQHQPVDADEAGR